MKKLTLALLFLIAASPAYAACDGQLQSNSNLADVCDVPTAQTNIGVTKALNAGFTYVIDAGGSAITTSTCSFTSGQLCVLEVPFACTISAVRMFADQTGSAVIEVAKTSYSSYQPGTHPVSGDKITSSTPPTISSTYKSQDTTLSGWTTSISAGDVVAFSVTSAATITRLNMSFTCVKS